MSTIAVTNLKHESASGNNITLDSSGNVGVGTTTPTPPTGYNGLHINATYPALKLSAASSGSGATDGFALRIDSTPNVELWNYENTAMTFATNNAERMRIDSSGRVTKPYQPAFLSLMTGSGSNTYSGYITYPAVIYNIGGHYNTSNGYFTAPVNGIYAFYLHTQAEAGSSGASPTRIHMTKNGSYYPTSTYGSSQLRMDNPNTTWDATWVIQLSAGDVVRVYVSARTINDDAAYEHFGGYMLG